MQKRRKEEGKMKERRRGRDSIRILHTFSEGSLNYDKVFYVKSVQY